MMAFTPEETQVALVAGISVAFCLAAGTAAIVDGYAHRRHKRRFEAVRDSARGVAVAGAAVTRSLARRQSATPKIDSIARRYLPRRDLLTARLARTGRQISIGQYAIAMVVLAAVTGIGLFLASPIGFFPSLLLGALVGMAIPHKVIGSMGNRRIKAFIALFPDAIDLMVRALRSGLPISEAIINAGHEIADPVGSELRLIEGGMRVGRSLDSLLWDTAKRINTPEFRFFVIALGVQRETGGNLAETLANLSEVLRARRQMRSKIRAISSESRATTAILGGLPIVVIILLTLVQPHYLVPMYTDVRGIIMGIIGVLMLVTGVTIMTKLAKFEI